MKIDPDRTKRTELGQAIAELADLMEASTRIAACCWRDLLGNVADAMLAEIAERNEGDD